MANNFLVKVQLVETKNRGRELVAAEDIPKGTAIWKWTYQSPDTRVLTEAQMLALPPDEKAQFMTYMWQNSDDEFISSVGDHNLDYSNFMNHSCDPSMWFADDDTLVARRSVKRNEPLTYDYGTATSKYVQVRKCQCGADKCRKTITPLDWMKVEHMWGHMRSYLDKKVNNCWKVKDASGRTTLMNPTAPKTSKSAQSSRR